MSDFSPQPKGPAAREPIVPAPGSLADLPPVPRRSNKGMLLGVAIGALAVLFLGGVVVIVGVVGVAAYAYQSQQNTLQQLQMQADQAREEQMRARAALEEAKSKERELNQKQADLEKQVGKAQVPAGLDLDLGGFGIGPGDLATAMKQLKQIQEDRKKLEAELDELNRMAGFPPDKPEPAKPKKP